MIKGFLYPEIDASLCVDCGLCTKACPVLNNHIDSESISHEEKSYAIWNKNVEDRLSSSSGGVFSALADKTLQDGGVVYGAAWDENMQLQHIGIEEAGKLDALRRSKYVQSDTDFYIYLDDANAENSRLVSTLAMFGLERQLYYETSSLPKIMPHIDYSTVDPILKEKRVESLRLLRESIERKLQK